ncbi:hypothetical protein QR98_0068140, partial [Sarcoptes scabiei]
MPTSYFYRSESQQSLSSSFNNDLYELGTSSKFQSTDNSTRSQIQQFLHTVSGQLKISSIQETEHSYAKNWNVHPDPTVLLRPAKFLFMKHFPHHLS